MVLGAVIPAPAVGAVLPRHPGNRAPRTTADPPRAGAACPTRSARSSALGGCGRNILGDAFGESAAALSLALRISSTSAQTSKSSPAASRPRRDLDAAAHGGVSPRCTLVGFLALPECGERSYGSECRRDHRDGARDYPGYRADIVCNRREDGGPDYGGQSRAHYAEPQIPVGAAVGGPCVRERRKQ